MESYLIGTHTTSSYTYINEITHDKKMYLIIQNRYDEFVELSYKAYRNFIQSVFEYVVLKWGVWESQLFLILKLFIPFFSILMFFHIFSYVYISATFFSLFCNFSIFLYSFYFSFHSVLFVHYHLFCKPHLDPLKSSTVRLLDCL